MLLVPYYSLLQSAMGSMMYKDLVREVGFLWKSLVPAWKLKGTTKSEVIQGQSRPHPYLRNRSYNKKSVVHRESNRINILNFKFLFTKYSKYNIWENKKTIWNSSSLLEIGRPYFWEVFEASFFEFLICPTIISAKQFSCCYISFKAEKLIPN